MMIAQSNNATTINAVKEQAQNGKIMAASAATNNRQRPQTAKY